MPRKKTGSVPPRHTIAVDWDGTCVTSVWPEMSKEWMPGAVKNLAKLSENNYVIIWSARIAPYEPFTGSARTPAQIQEQIQYIRDTLDEAGLTQIPVWTHPWKPGADVYIDDKAERYHGRPGSWDAVADKVLLRLGAQDVHLPPVEDVPDEVYDAYMAHRRLK